jgi:hypothetical protein
VLTGCTAIAGKNDAMQVGTGFRQDRRKGSKQQAESQEGSSRLKKEKDAHNALERQSRS